MPVCTNYNAVQNPITASHRPVLPSMETHLLLYAVQWSVGFGEQEPGEPKPSQVTAMKAMNMIAEIPPDLVGSPDVSSFWGEIHLTWNAENRQVVVMAFPDRESLVHHYERIPNAPSRHDIELASRERVAHWLRWLRG